MNIDELNINGVPLCLTGMPNHDAIKILAEVLGILAGSKLNSVETEVIYNLFLLFKKHHCKQLNEN